MDARERRPNYNSVNSNSVQGRIPWTAPDVGERRVRFRISALGFLSGFELRISDFAPRPAGNDRMHDDKTVQRFIDLRVQGWSFARLAAELNVSKPTLIAWSRKHQHTIANLVAIEREERLNQLINTTEERLSRMGAELRAAETELAKRDLSTLSTGRLLSHIESLRRQVRREAGPLQFVSTVDAIPEEEYADRIQVWKP